MNLHFLRKLPIPKEIKEAYPVAAADAAAKESRDRIIRGILEGRDDRFLLVIGPCSADRAEPVLEYLSRLRRLEDETRDRLLLIPRLYTNKPRTRGEGYMGMLHQPDPDGAPDLLSGLIAIRSLHLRALADYGFSCADELLYPDNHRYLSDLLSYVAVGARSVEDQYHRLTASGLSIPVGMKNRCDGDLSAMLNAIRTANGPHAFLYRGWEVQSEGNPLAHAVLRGGMDENGRYLPNYHEEDLRHLYDLFAETDIPCPTALVDTNHANSGKRWEKQPGIALEVMAARRHDPAVRRTVRGLMIESYLLDGAQPVGGGLFGCSITDPCLGWDKTRELVLRIADLA